MYLPSLGPEVVVGVVVPAVLLLLGPEGVLDVGDEGLCNLGDEGLCHLGAGGVFQLGLEAARHLVLEGVRHLGLGVMGDVTLTCSPLVPPMLGAILLLMFPKITQYECQLCNYPGVIRVNQCHYGDRVIPIIPLWHLR